MALSDKNILITPNIGAVADPKIVFSGADATTSPQNVTMQVYPTSNGTLSIDGSVGQLFSITSNMTGTIFSVNDISGIPSIEVLDTGLIKLAQYNGNVGIKTSTANYPLDVNGTANISGNLFVTGNVVSNGVNLGVAIQSSTKLTGVTPYANVTYASTVTLTPNTNIRLILTGNVALVNPVTAGDGDIIRIWATASGANTNVTLDANTVIPTTSVFTSPVTITNGQKARISMQYDSVRLKWELVAFVNGY